MSDQPNDGDVRVMRNGEWVYEQLSKDDECEDIARTLLRCEKLMREFRRWFDEDFDPTESALGSAAVITKDELNWLEAFDRTLDKELKGERS